MATKSIANPALSAVVNEANNAEVRFNAAATHFAQVQQDMAIAMAIMDAVQAIVGADGNLVDDLSSGKTLADLLAHGRNRLDGAGIDLEELFHCFRLERAAAEASHG